MAGVRDVVYQRRRSSGSQQVLLADPLQSEPGAVAEGLALHLARLSDHLEGSQSHSLPSAPLGMWNPNAVSRIFQSSLSSHLATGPTTEG